LPVIAFVGVSCCFFERQLRQTFYKFHGFNARRHLALLFVAFLVKSASHQQTLLQNAANSGLRFGSRCFILIIFRHRLPPVSLSVTVFQGVAYRFKWLSRKHRQTTVCLPTLY
jgi:hypothetical protein